MQYNFKRHFAIRADVLYAYNHCPYPDVADPFNKSYGLEQHTLLVPLMFQLHTSDPANSVFFNLGGFYGRTLDGGFYGRNATSGGPDYEAQDNQWGYVLGFGFRLGYHWVMDFSFYQQLNELFDTSNGLPKTKKNIATITLGYYF